MPRGKVLTEYEKGMIDALKTSGEFTREIAPILKRSRHVINNYLNMKGKYGFKKRSGRKSTFSKRDIRNILRLARSEKYNIPQIKAFLQLAQSRQTIWRVVNRSKCLKFGKRKQTFYLSKKQKVARLLWAKNHMSWTKKWASVIFSDEKKFNLEGPDRRQYY